MPRVPPQLVCTTGLHWTRSWAISCYQNQFTRDYFCFSFHLALCVFQVLAYPYTIFYEILNTFPFSTKNGLPEKRNCWRLDTVYIGIPNITETVSENGDRVGLVWLNYVDNYLHTLPWTFCKSIKGIWACVFHSVIFHTFLNRLEVCVLQWFRTCKVPGQPWYRAGRMNLFLLPVLCEFYKVWFLLVSWSCSVSIWGECLDLMCLSRSLRLTRILPQRSHLKQQYYFILQIVSMPHSDPSAWRKAAQLLPLFHFTVCRDPHVLVQCISANIRFLLALATFKGVGNGFIWLADMHHI